MKSPVPRRTNSPISARGTSQIMRGSLFANALSPNNCANGTKLTMLMEKITPPSMPSAKTPRWGRR